MIRILVDSASDYQLEETKEKNMEFVPLQVNLNGKTYLDGINLGRDELFEIMESTGEFAKTSQPSPQAFLEIFEDVKEKGDELICILLSGALSGTFQSAVLAKDIADYDKIYLIDSKTGSYCNKVLADYAWNLVEEGLAAEAIVEKVEELKKRVKIIATLDTLEYLARGGRISKAIAAIGEVAKLKPMVTVTEDGHIVMSGKSLGINKGITSLVKQLQKDEIDTDFPLYTLYAYGTENCAKCEEKLETAGYKITSRMQIGATVGTHIGPEGVGIVYVKR